MTGFQQSKRGLDQMSWADAIWIGISQALAVVPGTSRSGITITAARFRALDREAAARFSFLLSTPAIAAAAAKDAWDLHKEGGVPAGMGLPYAVGILVSGVVGIVVIAFFLKYLKRNTLAVVRLVSNHLWHNNNRSGCVLPYRRMRFLSPTRYSRLNEVVGFLLLLGGLGLALSLASYSPLDPSWNTATGVARPANLMGRFGAYFSDLALQGLGISAYLMPALHLVAWLEMGAFE